MFLVLFATLCVSLAAGRVLDDEFTLVSEEEDAIVWPDTYTVKARKISLTANLVEDFSFWKTNQSSRLDSNQGAVKMFASITNDTEWESYEIHPETDVKENVKLVCSNLRDGIGSEVGLALPGILPNVHYSDYKAIKNETINGKEAIRFEYTQHDSEEDNIYVLWAFDDNETGEGENAWVPISERVNNKLGSLTKHEIWDYYEFYVDFDDYGIFDVKSFGCEEDKVVQIYADSDAVTKELMFVNTEKKHHVDHIFNSFQNKFNRKYAHEEEHNLRRSIFKQNMRLISATNSQNLGYKLGINQFADRTPDELKKRTGLLKRPQGKFGNKPFPYNETTLKTLVNQLPSDVDLRLQGLVTPVQDQLDCGSCWTFGTTSAMEGAIARANGSRLLRLSNQALIDCAWGFGASGCDGGSDNAAYEWMMNYGLPTVEEYGSYENKDGFCHITNMTTIYPIKGYTDVTPFSNEALKVALYNHGPLSVSVEVTHQFGLYSSGIYYEKDCGPSDLNHEVTLVGYGEQYGELFWILKNSYGVSWGMDGYMLISARDNDCGVATEPTYIVL